MKNLILKALTLLTFTLLYSCGSLKHVKLPTIKEAKVPVKKKKYKTIEIVKIDGRSANELENFIENALLHDGALTPMHRESRQEILDNRLSSRNSKIKRADISVHGIYKENIYPRVSQHTGNLTYFGFGNFNFKLVENKTNRVIYTDELIVDYQKGSNMKSFVEREVREIMAERFAVLFSDQEVEEWLPMEPGKDNKFIKIVRLVEKKKFKEAIKEQEKYLNSDSKEDISDSHHNLALIHHILGNVRESRDHYHRVSNGFMNRDHRHWLGVAISN